MSEKENALEWMDHCFIPEHGLVVDVNETLAEIVYRMTTINATTYSILFTILHSMKVVVKKTINTLLTINF